MLSTPAVADVCVATLRKVWTNASSCCSFLSGWGYPFNSESHVYMQECAIQSRWMYRVGVHALQQDEHFGGREGLDATSLQDEEAAE